MHVCIYAAQCNAMQCGVIPTTLEMVGSRFGEETDMREGTTTHHTPHKLVALATCLLRDTIIALSLCSPHCGGSRLRHPSLLRGVAHVARSAPTKHTSPHFGGLRLRQTSL